MSGSGVFLQTDPIPGGSANAYDYANQDPINNYDLSGDCWICDVLGGELAVAIPDEWNPVGWVTDVVIAGTVVIVGGYYTVKGTYDLGQGIARMAKSRKSDKEKSNDLPGWVNPEAARELAKENGADNAAERIMNEKYGGNWRKGGTSRTRRNRNGEIGTIKKWLNRG